MRLAQIAVLLFGLPGIAVAQAALPPLQPPAFAASDSGWRIEHQGSFIVLMPDSTALSINASLLAVQDDTTLISREALLDLVTRRFWRVFNSILGRRSAMSAGEYFLKSTFRPQHVENARSHYALSLRFGVRGVEEDLTDLSAGQRFTSHHDWTKVVQW